VIVDLVPDDLRFRSLAAPGLDEDDLFVAMWGLPAHGLWGGDGSWSRPPADEPWDEAAERRRRHEELLRKWESAGGPPDATSPPT
jgi:hypothetical protein